MSDIELRLLWSVKQCAGAFKNIAAILVIDQPETTNFHHLKTDWDKYYFNTFPIFDRYLKTYVETGGDQYEKILPISISHHNLQRLMQVLRKDVEGEILGNTQIPERIIDLVEVIRRLDVLLEETASLYEMNENLVKSAKLREVNAGVD
jgi:hypothetical protein